MKFNDMVWGALLMALGFTVLNDVRTYPSIPGQQYGPNAFPGLLAALLIVCAVMLMVKGWKERAQHPWFARNTADFDGTGVRLLNPFR